MLTGNTVRKTSIELNSNYLSERMRLIFLDTLSQPRIGTLSALGGRGLG
jgi:hypothetical protein